MQKNKTKKTSGRPKTYNLRNKNFYFDIISHHLFKGLEKLLILSEDVKKGKE